MIKYRATIDLPTMQAIAQELAEGRGAQVLYPTKDEAQRGRVQWYTFRSREQSQRGNPHWMATACATIVQGKGWWELVVTPHAVNQYARRALGLPLPEFRPFSRLRGPFQGGQQ